MFPFNSRAGNRVTTPQAACIRVPSPPAIQLRSYHCGWLHVRTSFQDFILLLLVVKRGVDVCTRAPQVEILTEIASIVKRLAGEERGLDELVKCKVHHALLRLLHSNGAPV